MPSRTPVLVIYYQEGHQQTQLIPLKSHILIPCDHTIQFQFSLLGGANLQKHARNSVDAGGAVHLNTNILREQWVLTFSNQRLE